MYNIIESGDKMNNAWIIIIIIFTILILIGIIIFTFYNKLLNRKKRVEEKFIAINDCLNEKKDIINKIEELLIKENYSEQNLLLGLKQSRAEIENKNTINNTLSLIDEVDKNLENALNLDNVYEELKNNNNFQQLKEIFKNNKYKLMYTKEIYNEEAEKYNNYKNQGIQKIVSKIFKLNDYNYYKKQ